MYVGFVLCLLTGCLLLQDTIPAAQDAPLMSKFKVKGKGEKHKMKAAKQHISMEPADLMNGEDGQSLFFSDVPFALCAFRSCR